MTKLEKEIQEIKDEREKYIAEYHYNTVKAKSIKDIKIDYALFWFWANGKGYDITKGQFKVAWQDYITHTELPQVQDCINHYYYTDTDNEIRREAFNEYVIERIKQEQANKGDK